MSELKSEKGSPLNGKQINGLGNSEVSEVTSYILNRNKKQ